MEAEVTVAERLRLRLDEVTYAENGGTVDEGLL